MRHTAHRETIALLVDNGHKAADIARLLRMNPRTVQKIVKQYRETGSVQPKKKSGRPVTVNTPQLRKVIRERIRRNNQRSLNKLASDLRVSRRTVQRIVKCNLAFRSYRIFRGQMLTPANKENRLRKAKVLLQELGEARISDIIWTDEKIFTIQAAPNSQNQRQLLRPSSGNSGQRVVRTRPLFPKSVMVWAGITSEDKTPLVFVERSVKINAHLPGRNPT